jgi:hypothetical protein
MEIGMNLQKVLCGAALGVSGLLALIFLLDLLLGIPFGRFSISTDIIVLLAAGLILWQGVETWLEL